MNKTRIGWCDFSWNPVTGCKRGCPYCFAARQAGRFCGDVRRNKTSWQLTREKGGYILEQPFKGDTGKTILFPTGFEPTLHRYRLPMVAQKKKPANIFVCSMGDLFASDIPDSWIEEVMAACAAAPWHNYLFLTKFPERYEQLCRLGLLPTGANYWYGTTITRESELERMDYLYVAGGNAFLCLEPLQEAIDLSKYACALTSYIGWIIAGAETGNRRGKVSLQWPWVNAIVEVAGQYGIPLFLKDSGELKALWGEDLPHALPKGLQRPMERPIPHCKECEDLVATPRHYNPALNIVVMNHRCEAAGCSIPGRYVRSSPAWCPKRGGSSDAE